MSRRSTGRRISWTYQAEEEEAKGTVVLTLATKARGRVPGVFVGVPEFLLVTGCAGTSTYAPPTRPGATEAKGVDAAATVLPSMSARTPTPLQEAERRPLMEGATAKGKRVGVSGVARVMLPATLGATPDTPTPKEEEYSVEMATGEGGTATGGDAMGRYRDLRYCRSHRQD